MGAGPGTNGAGRDKRYVLITGGCGFLGTNLADRLLRDRVPVMVFDNLSRSGVERNLDWLADRHAGQNLQVRLADVRDQDAIRRAVAEASAIYHFAAQVAVTTSILDPMDDFSVNVVGTLNILDALRAMDDPPPLVFTSTNKVYGDLDDVPLASNTTRYVPVSAPTRDGGIDETRPLQFHSPYGCSKGTADQYILDFARTFSIPAVVFRMSCVYGPHQFGTEDQGWVAHFLLRALSGRPITLFGDGKQVRDILYVEDLVRALLLARDRIGYVSGSAFNIGGGPGNAVSLIELIHHLEAVTGTAPSVIHRDWRRADQRYYVSDFSKFRALTGWSPAVGIHEGLRRLLDWTLPVRHWRTAGSRGLDSAREPA